MAEIWTRDTPWRQGHILTDEAAKAFGLSHPESPDSTCVVVISHDCDLANDALQVEPDVEVIVGRHLPKGDGNYFWAKAPRKLHVDVLKHGTATVVELAATAKQILPKHALVAFSPDAAYSLPGKSLSALRSWLAVRYNRAAFPDLFVSRLSECKVDKRLAKIIEPVGNLLSAVYFEVDGGTEVDHSDGSPYELKIVLAYPPGDDPEQAADDVEKLETAITQIFEEKHFDHTTGEWNGISLKQCISISEDDLRVSRARLLTQWRLEYMTLKADGEQTGAPV
ncbi:hypothetical protein [Methylomonas koyamae]|uniref:hypothetical protein n=1 Tax=Methylomonas koyamae TaxID=702114 RepID=UPI002873662F|nr:hypothetical protein [Methylomonas koyamae]WNB74836.1 hypothetical protein RI210_16325 [Methylomonas koyamae]